MNLISVCVLFVANREKDGFSTLSDCRHSVFETVIMLPCAVGPRAAIRNAGLTMALATVMIYPDHLRVSSSAPKTGGREGEPS